MNSLPLISVIIPTYKRDTDILKRALESVIVQTYKKLEIIIVDDNGINSKFTEENEEFICKNYNKENIKYIKNDKNIGANASRNIGIKISKGELIAFLDSDDKWSENKLELVVEKYRNSDSDYGVFYSSYYIVTKNGIKNSQDYKVCGDIFYKELFKDQVSPTSAVVIKKECFDNVGEFDENLPARQDYDMWIKISRKYKFNFINSKLAYVYRDGHEAISSNYKKRIEGTEIVLSKILDYIKLENITQIEDEVKLAQYIYISKICFENNDYRLAYIYALKARKLRGNLESMMIVICCKIPVLYIICKLIKKIIRIIKEGFDGIILKHTVKDNM